MDKHAKTILLAGVLVGASAAYAQGTATPPPERAGDPTAASSPHQRDATGATGATTSETAPTTSPDADAAASPHQKSATTSMPSQDQLKMASQNGAIPASFVKNAALDGMTEVELGQIALSKSQDASIKKFAQRMVDDHGMANEELASIARQKGLMMPTALDTEHKSMVQTLNAKSGKAFDAAYSEHMKADHAKAVALFQGAVTGSDPELAAFAKKTLPTLEQHKQMAKSLSTSRTADASNEGRTTHE
jgi:putative membrane protein